MGVGRGEVDDGASGGVGCIVLKNASAAAAYVVRAAPEAEAAPASDPEISDGTARSGILGGGGGGGIGNIGCIPGDGGIPGGGMRIARSAAEAATAPATATDTDSAPDTAGRRVGAAVSEVLATLGAALEVALKAVEEGGCSGDRTRNRCRTRPRS